MSWLGYQSLIVFALTFVLGNVSADEQSGAMLFSLALGLVVGGAAIVFVLGILLRKPFLSLEKSGFGRGAINRLLGGLCAVVNLAVFLLSIASLALVALQGVEIAELDVVYSNTIWTDFLSAHAFDFFIVCAFLALLQSGYRAGFMRMIFHIVIVALVFVSVFLGMYMTLQVPFLNDFSHFIGSGLVASLGKIGADWVGFAIASFIVAFVFVLVTVLIGVLLNLFLKFIGKFRIMVALNGALGFAVTAVVLVVVVLGLNTGVYYVESGALAQLVPEEMGELASSLQTYGQAVRDVLSSSVLGNIFYACNPMRALIA